MDRGESATAGAAVVPGDLEVLRVVAATYDRSTELRAELNRRFVQQALPFRAEFLDPFGGDPTLSIRYDATVGSDEPVPVVAVREEAGASSARTAERVVERLTRYARGLARSHAQDPESTLWCNPD
jgi:hypothetical protein